MHTIDWLIMIIPLGIGIVIAVYSRRFVRSIADFMAGGRNAGRFLICTARSEQGAGAVMFVAAFQIFAVAGFTLNWWWFLSVPVGMLVAITGFVVYRYRETRALTLGQFFEMRYSKKFRLFAGGLAFFAGLVNFGVIPIIGARFMVNFLQLPPVTQILGLAVPTHLIVMGLFLTICVVLTTLGGQISVLLTDCAEGMFSQLFYVIIAVGLMIFFFHWSQTRSMLLATAPGKSLVNPFDSFSLKDFNIWYVLMAISVNVYATMAWQNSHAFNASGATPHEARMGRILASWREFASRVMVVVLAACALSYLDSAAGKALVDQALANIPDKITVSQMRMPIALSYLLPAGLKGALLSICLMGIISGDGIHLHSWSSLLVQDVIVPLRRKALTLKQHLLLLRLAIVGVAVFAFVFGAVFPQTEYLQIWWGITQAIYTGGAGAAIIGGLYWSRGTSAGAWIGFIMGSVLSVGGIITRIYYQKVLGHDFFLNGQQIGFIATLIAISSYVIVSLLTCRKPHNMARLLHRGEYAIAPDAGQITPPEKKINWINRAIGITAEFSRSDRWITLGIFWWSIFWFVIFVVGSIACLIHPVSNKVWADYWFFQAILLPLGIGIVTTVWFTIGCLHDMRVFFKRLREEKINLSDDGMVTHNDN